MGIAAISAMIAAVCYTVVVIVFFAFHVIAPKRSVIAHAVSDYGLGRTGRLFVVYGIIGCLGAILLAVATATTSLAVFPARVSIYLVFLATLRLGALRFRTDIEGAAVTREGRIHLAFAVLTFALTYMVVAAAQPTVDGFAGPILAPIFGALGWVAAISLTGVVVTLLPPLRRVFGLVERVFLLSTALCLLVLALALVG